MNFKELNISDEVISSLKKLGYTSPTEVQEKVIPQMLSGVEVVVRSRTGSGKTAAFGISLIELIAKDRTKKGLVIAPTRELAIQITNELRAISHDHKFKIYAIYGGQSINKQIENIRSGFDILVGTPGRLLDHINRRTVNMNKTEFVVLDEADLMLDMGFEEDVKDILEKTSKNKKMFLFSATIGDRIKSLSYSYMKQPKFMEVGSVDVEEIEEEIIRIKRKDKFGKLLEIIKEDENNKIMIFVATKHSVEYISNKLNDAGINARYIHGDKSQNQRERTMNDFKKHRFKILVATDVAARGLQINGVDIIINYDKANTGDTHKHRIGRTGRMGEKGRAITFEDIDPYIPRGRNGGGRNHSRGGYSNSSGNRSRKRRSNSIYVGKK